MIGQVLIDRVRPRTDSDTSSFLPTSLSPVRTDSYDTLLILLSLLEPVLTGDLN